MSHDTSVGLLIVDWALNLRAVFCFLKLKITITVSPVSSLSCLFCRVSTENEGGRSRGGRVHFLTGNLRPGEQRLRQLLHQTGALKAPWVATQAGHTPRHSSGPGIKTNHKKPQTSNMWRFPASRKITNQEVPGPSLSWIPATPGNFLFESKNC